MVIILSLLAGGLISWLITFHYYNKQLKIEKLRLPLDKLIKISEDAKKYIHEVNQMLEAQEGPLFGDNEFDFLDEDFDGIFTACPICKRKDGMFKIIPWQGEDGGREDHYHIGCLKCKYIKFVSDIPLNMSGEIDESVKSIRKLNFIMRGIKTPVVNHVILLNNYEINGTEYRSVEKKYEAELSELKEVGLYSWGWSIDGRI